MSIINIKQAAILHGSSLVLGFLLAVIVVRPVGDHHVFRGKTAEIEEMRFCSMMRYLDAPVMFVKLDLSVIILCDHLHILWLYISGKQKIQLAVAGTVAGNGPVFPHSPEVPEILLLPVIHEISFPVFPG